MEQNNKHSQKSQPRLVTLFAVFIVLFLTTCTEDPLRISPDILPDDGTLDVFVTTIPVEMYTVSTDPIYTRSIGISPLGSVNDNTIGNLQTDFFADFIYSEEPFFKDETDLDSIRVREIVIDLVYSGDKIYGDLQELDFNVYELLEPMPQYTKSDFYVLPHMYDPVPLNTEIWHQNETYNAALSDRNDTCHIVLNNTFAQRFLDSTMIDQNVYNSENQSLFKNYFKGFYFKVDARSSAGGAIIVVDQSKSRMVLRTESWNADSLDWIDDSTVFSVGNPSSAIDSGGVHLNIYRNTFRTNIVSIINDTVSTHDYSYIQSLSGPMVYIKLPTLDALRDSLAGMASINRAQLILPIEMENYTLNKDLYPAPALLGLIDGESKSAVYDFTVAENHLGGKLDTTITDNYRYILNIENHLHAYFRDESSELSSTFYLFSAIVDEDDQGIQYLRHTRYLPETIVLNGRSSPNPPVVRIVYSKIQE